MLSRAVLQQLNALFPTLQTLSAASRERLTQEAQYARIEAGAVLFDFDEPCAVFPLLLSGRMRVAQTSDNGREMTLYRLHPGDMCVISASCLFGSDSYPVRGVADAELEIVSLSPQLFNTLIAQDACFRSFVFRLFAERLHDVLSLVEAIAFQRLDQRLAALLLTKGASIHATQQSLADELGSAREVMSRLLRRFEEQGLVQLSREKILVANVAGLRKIAEP